MDNCLCYPRCYLSLFPGTLGIISTLRTVEAAYQRGIEREPRASRSTKAPNPTNTPYKL